MRTKAAPYQPLLLRHQDGAGEPQLPAGDIKRPPLNPVQVLAAVVSGHEPERQEAPIPQVQTTARQASRGAGGVSARRTPLNASAFQARQADPAALRVGRAAISRAVVGLRRSDPPCDGHGARFEFPWKSL
jgi:hypothetical protein